jgi:parvulin-like peptidyl-prolyl isomerase
VLADARRQLNDDSVIHQLKQQVEDVPAAEAGAVREYYRAHPDKFTTPERVRVSMILLKVEPWAPGAAWAAAEEEAGRLREKLGQGADFAELARLHSADASAEHGGELGYIHRGMFSAETQGVIDGLAPGSLSAPVRLLQGYALFRLDERVPPRLNEFAQAEERARGLLRREQQEAAWEAMRAGLRKNARIEIDEAVLGAGE